jgi:glycosyltransferase involved in cell wall biosynthesis
MVTYLGGIISLFSFVLAVFFLIQTLLLNKQPEGWPSLIVTLLFLGGIQLIGIGAVGEYIGRIFITQNKRPQFTIKDICRNTRTAIDHHNCSGGSARPISRF